MELCDFLLIFTFFLIFAILLIELIEKTKEILPTKKFQIFLKKHVFFLQDKKL